MKGKTRNEQIAELLASGERLKDFYRFTAQNPHIDLHDACQIVLAPESYEKSQGHTVLRHGREQAICL